MLTLLIGGLSFIALPILGNFLGKDFGFLLLLLNVRKRQKRVKYILNRTDQEENGKANPHQKLIEATSNSWSKIFPKQLFHTSVHVLCKVGMGVSAVTGLVGAFQSNISLQKWSVIGLGVGLASLFMENSRYGMNDGPRTEIVMRQIGWKVEDLLEIKEPYIPSLPPMESPEV